MSQKEGKFQSKSRSAGGKFSKGGKGGFGGDKPRGGKFGKKFEGDRPSFDRDKPRGGGFKSRDRDDRGDDRPRGRGGKPAFGRDRDRDGDSKPRSRSFGRDRDDARSSFGDRKPRRSFDDKPRGGDFGDRPRKPRGDFGDRPRSSERSFGDKPRRSFGDKPRGGDFGDRPRKPRGDFGDRPRSSERSFGDRKPRRSFDDKPRGDFADRPRKPRGDFDDRPRKPREDAERKSPRHADRFASKGYQRYEEKRDISPDDDEDDDIVYSIANPAETKAKLKSDRAGYGAPSSAFLFGVHPVTQALKNPARIHQRLLCTKKGYEAVAKIIADMTDDGLKMPQVIYVDKEDIERLLPHGAVHQDLLLDCQPLEDISLDDILDNAPEDAKVLVLDQVTDPHNVGAIIRSAAAFGAFAVVVQKLNAPDITGTLAKSASGAVEHVPFVRETNLSRALEKLKEKGFFCIGLAEEGKRTIADMNLSGKVALVMGAEGDGLRRLVAENCDELAKLPTQGEIGSLNVSNAAAVALYELVRK